MFLSFWYLLIVLAISNFSLIECVPEKERDTRVWRSEGNVSSVFATAGDNKHMEDEYIRCEKSSGFGVFGIFDGHTGGFSSMYAANYLQKAILDEIDRFNKDPKKSIYTLQEPHKKLNFTLMLTDKIDRVETKLKIKYDEKVHNSGTTCLLVIAEKELLTVANIGDSRAVMCNSEDVAIDLSIDQKPNRPDEKERIERAGGHVTLVKQTWRVEERLAVTRSLGDFAIKSMFDFILATPEFSFFNLNEHKPKFMILASDGLWDVMTSQEAVDFILKNYPEKPHSGAYGLADHALDKLRAWDNVAVIIVSFTNGRFEITSANAK